MTKIQCDRCGKLLDEEHERRFRLNLLGPQLFGERDEMDLCSWSCLEALAREKTEESYP